MENSLLDGTRTTVGGGDAETGEGFGEVNPAKDFDFSQEGGAWEEAKRYNSSLVDD